MRRRSTVSPRRPFKRLVACEITRDARLGPSGDPALSAASNDAVVQALRLRFADTSVSVMSVALCFDPEAGFAQTVPARIC